MYRENKRMRDLSWKQEARLRPDIWDEIGFDDDHDLLSMPFPISGVVARERRCGITLQKRPFDGHLSRSLKNLTTGC